VRLLGVEKEMLGVMSLMQAMDLADEAGTDVVLVNPQGVPPVVRLIQVSKYKFELAKAAKEASKKQREARCGSLLLPSPDRLRTSMRRGTERSVACASRQDMKELKLRPSTDVHDYQVRLRAAQKFLAKASRPAQCFAVPHLHFARFSRASSGACMQGDKVKLSLQFRGREIEMQDIGRDLFQVRCWSPPTCQHSAPFTCTLPLFFSALLHALAVSEKRTKLQPPRRSSLTTWAPRQQWPPSRRCRGAS